MDLDPQYCEKHEFYLDPCDILHKKGTNNFCDLNKYVCEKPSTEIFSLIQV